MRTAKAIWEVMRLEHGVMIALGILVGAVIAVPQFPALDVFVLTFLTALFLEASTFALNDYMDLDIDRRNKRLDRPLVRGDLSPRSALVLCAIFFPLGLLAAFFVNLPCFLIALVTALFALVYDIVLKRYKVVGNFFIAYVMAVPFVFGGVAVIPKGGTLGAIDPAILIVAIIAFLAGTGREMMKDVMDYRGDALAGVTSFPKYLGTRGTNALAAAFYLAAVLLSLVPFLLPGFGQYYNNLAYLGFVAVTDVLLFGAAFQLVVRPPTDLRRLRKVTLIALFIGLCAFLAGAFVG